MTLYNGWLIIDKPLGASSNDAVWKVKKLLGKGNKVGHAGTLDPLAHGVLPIALGEATKTVQYLMDAKKEYEFSVTWGQERATGDAEGEVVADGGHIPAKQDIEKILAKFFGKTMQMPPIYSALKINGQPAYKLARMGKEVELQPREITIDEFALTEHNEKEGISSFRVVCGKGTYVRSLAVDVARMLSTYGYVSHLKRTRVGNYLIQDAITPNDLANSELKNHLLPVTYGLGDILAIEINAEQTKILRNGVQIFLPEYSQSINQVAQILFEGILQATVCINNGMCKVMRVFNL